ncbi:hypothetical protein AB1N83_004491 [Pleurotus pulmonarius]
MMQEAVDGCEAGAGGFEARMFGRAAPLACGCERQASVQLLCQFKTLTKPWRWRTRPPKCSLSAALRTANDRSAMTVAPRIRADSTCVVGLGGSPDYARFDVENLADERFIVSYLGGERQCPGCFELKSGVYWDDYFPFDAFRRYTMTSQPAILHSLVSGVFQLRCSTPHLLHFFLPSIISFTRRDFSRAPWPGSHLHWSSASLPPFRHAFLQILALSCRIRGRYMRLP